MTTQNDKHSDDLCGKIAILLQNYMFLGILPGLTEAASIIAK